MIGTFFAIATLKPLRPVDIQRSLKGFFSMQGDLVTMKKMAFILFFTWLITPLFSVEKTQYTFFGWVDATELETTFQVDTSLVKTKSWTSVSSKPASVTGYFYKDISGAPVFKVTQIVPIEEDNDTFMPPDDLNYYEN